MSQRDEGYLIDIHRAARLVESFMDGINQEAFEGDIMRQSAVIHQLLIVGEATKRLSDEFRDAHSEVAWNRMAGMRDVLIHGYERVDLDEVWVVATLHIPDLIRQLEPLVSPY